MARTSPRSDGGGSFTSKADGFLKSQFVNLKQANGFLYLFGDSSINVISNVQTTGTTPTTTFNNQNVDPQTGLAWRDSLAAFGRTLCFANSSGVYALFGGAAEKISQKLDNLFATANFLTVIPTMFITILFGTRCLGLTFNTKDPTTGTQRTIMALWNGAKWFVASQSVVPIITTTLQQSSVPSGWGTDGASLFPMFTVASAALPKKIVSKLWKGSSQIVFKNAMRLYCRTLDIAGTGVLITGTVDSDQRASVAFSLTSNLNWLNNAGQPIQFQNNLAQNIRSF